MGDKKGDYRKVFRTAEQTLGTVIEQLSGEYPQLTSLEGFSPTDYWQGLATIADQLCFEANKISLAWISPPLPPVSDMAALSQCLELAAIKLLGAYHNFPRDAGDLVRASLTAAIRSVMESCRSFLATLADTVGRKYPANSHPALQSFGKVLESCEVVKSLPKSNKEAALAALKDQYDILKDALGELEEARSSGVMEAFGEEEELEEQWKEGDSQLINPSVGLMKTSVALVKRVLATVRGEGRQENTLQLQEYDGLVEQVSRLSPAVDDLALSLYPPLHWPDCKEANYRLKLCIESLLLHLSSLHFMSSDPAISWAGFVAKAVTHNFSEIQRVFVTRGLGEIRISEPPEAAPAAPEAAGES